MSPSSSPGSSLTEAHRWLFQVFNDELPDGRQRPSTLRDPDKLLRALRTWLRAWRADPERAAELTRRATIVADLSCPGTKYDEAEIAGLAGLAKLPSARVLHKVLPRATLRARAHERQERHALTVQRLTDLYGALKAVSTDAGIKAPVRRCLEVWRDAAQRVLEEIEPLKADACAMLENLDDWEPKLRGFAGTVIARCLRRGVKALDLWSGKRSGGKRRLGGSGGAGTGKRGRRGPYKTPTDRKARRQLYDDWKAARAADRKLTVGQFAARRGMQETKLRKQLEAERAARRRAAKPSRLDISQI